MPEGSEGNYQTNYSSYNARTQQDDFLQYRLDTSKLIEQIKVTLSGRLQSYVINPETNGVELKEEIVSEPLVNKQGFVSIVNFVSTNINNQTVQGNLKEDAYYNIIADIREDFSYQLFVNMYNWDVDEQYFSYIVDTVLNVVRLFLTRLIDNEERRSYGTLTENRDSVVQKPKLKFT